MNIETGVTRVVIDGHVCIDRNTLEDGRKYIGPGGPPNFMRQIFEQFPDSFITVIAPYGLDYRQYLDGTNIYPLSPNVAKTLIYENNSYSGRRTQRAINREQALPVPIDEKVLGELRRADIVLVTPLLPNYPASSFETIAGNTTALKVLLPQGFFRDFDVSNTVLPKDFSEAEYVLPNLDVVIVSEEDHPDILNLAQMWSSQHRDLIAVVTLGEKGALAFQNQSRIEVPTKKVPKEEVVDSVGCGDVFSVAFAFEYRTNRSIARALRFANQVARQRLFQPADKITVNLGSISI